MESSHKDGLCQLSSRYMQNLGDRSMDCLPQAVVLVKSGSGRVQLSKGGTLSVPKAVMEGS